jgi:hypothetical protein
MPLTPAQAFLIQAISDFEAYKVLQRSKDQPECQWLHALQMACEKLAKAYQANSGSDFNTVSVSHVSFSKQVASLYREYAARYGSRGVGDRTTEIRAVRRTAREIELLNPAIDPVARPDNCEYPWIDLSGAIVSPVQYKFDIARRLSHEPEGKKFLKFVDTSMRDLASDLGV